MINTQTQIDSLIDLAVIQRTELKQLVESLPQLRDHLSSEIERNLEEIEPAIRSELEQFVAARALDTQAKTSAELGAKLDAMARNLESTTAAKYSVLMAERAQNATLLAQAEARIAEAASALPGAVKGIVTDELARFPRAGEIDQLRKEFAEPRGLNPRGRWQVGETYNKLDLVSYNGDSYVSNTDGNREKPSRSSEAWTLSAARGNGGGGGGATSLTDLVPVPANGELLIGNGSAFVNNTLTAGTGVTITNGPGSITIDASGAQELLTATVTNAESFAITRGQVVYLFGATGNRASVKLADNSSDAASSKTFGVVSDASISANGIGLITCVGVVDGLSLGAYSAGDVLYLGNTPGSVTVTKPYAPNHLVYVGMVERANNGNGELYVRIQNGYELDEIHDVQITSAPLAGSLLMRDETNSLWKANRLTGTANQVTVTNADTAVTLSLPTAIANVNSVTAQSATNLTLAGGSTGASLVLGQGATSNITLTPKGTGGVDVSSTIRATGLQGGTFTGSGVELGFFSGAGNLFAYNRTSSAALPLILQSPGGNVLIGTTTDISGTGGLKVAGTSTASSTTSGALQVGSNVGLSGNAGGASYFGGRIDSSATGSAAAPVFSNGSSGIYFSATNGTMVFSATGSQTMTLNSGSVTTNGAHNITSTSPSTGVGTGALQVAGGIYAGAASVFGGAVTATGNAAVSAGLLVVNATGAAGQRYIDFGNGAGFTALRILRPSGVNGFGLQSYDSANIDLNVLGGSGGAFTISDNGTTRFTLTSAGAATFAGAVTASNGITLGSGKLLFAGNGEILAGQDSGGYYFANGAGATTNVPINIGDAASLQVFRTSASAAAGSRRLVLGPAGTFGLGGTITNTGTMVGAAISYDNTTVAVNFAATFAGAVTVNGTGTSQFSGLTVIRNTLADSVSLRLLQNNTGSAGFNISATNAGTLAFARIGQASAFTIDNTINASFGGIVSVSSSTASTNTTSGALVVTGGVGVGGALNVGGAVSATTSGNTALTVTSTDSATGVPFVRVGYNSNLSGQLSNDASTGKTYVDSRYNDVSSAVIIRTKASGTPVVNATFDSTGATTFAGAVAINNTTSAAVAAPSTHKVSILIGGVQYYLLASNV